MICPAGIGLSHAQLLPFRHTTSMNISHIPDERLEEFRRLYAEEFGEEISRDEASVRALQLIELYRLLMDLETRSDPPPAQSDPAAA
jgi:hypothetical protein